MLDLQACPACGWRRPAATSQVGKELWRTELNSKLIKPGCYATIAGAYFCVSTEDGALIALDLESGKRVWEQSLGEGEMAYALAADASHVFVGTTDQRPIPLNGKILRSLDARTGALLWQYPTRADSLSAAAVAGAVLYCAGSDGLLHCVEAATGAARWAVAHPCWGPAAPAVGHDIICVGGRGNMLVAYAPTDGRERWRFTAEGWFAAPISIDGDRIFALCGDGFLYALDARTGQLIWKYKGERGHGITNAPMAQNGQVFVGSRVYLQGGQQAGGYALLALRQEDGTELWRFYTQRPIEAPHTVHDDILLFGLDDGVCYALDATNGRELWRMEAGARIVTQPIGTDIVAYFGDRPGIIHAICYRESPSEQLLAPDVHLSRGEYEQAAIAYALSSNFEQAASIYEKDLSRFREAAQLYERAEMLTQAAPLWERLGDLRHAREIYHTTQDSANEARILEHMGEPLHAAQLYEQIGKLEAAANLYVQSGDRIRAATLYSQIGLLDQAQRIWEALGDWEQLVKALLSQGKLDQAARILEEQNQMERSAQIYEEANGLQQALAIRLQLEHWERVASLAARVGNHEAEALAWEHLSNPARAAPSYEWAAQQLASITPIDEERVATLYERAADLFAATYNEEGAIRCRRQIQRFRHLPEIVVTGEAKGVFVEHQWNSVKLRVKNTGSGPAANIKIELRGLFEVRGNHLIAKLPQKKIEPLEMFVRPHEDQYGPKVPLEIVISYQDIKGNQYEVVGGIAIHVVQKDTQTLGNTPLHIHVDGRTELPDMSRSFEQAITQTGEKSPPFTEDIEQQNQLLSSYRQSLTVYLRQQALLGEAYVPPGVVHGIRECRENIRRIKNTLSLWGATFENHPDDEPPTA